MGNGAVITAAGIASRMGEFKPLLPMGEETVIDGVIRTLRQAGVEKIVVVTGYCREMLEQHLFSAGVMFVHNERFAQTQMFDSVKLGLKALGESCQKILITPADVPLFKAQTIERLLQQQGGCVRPVYQGKPGHPLLIDGSAVCALLACSGKEGLRGAIVEAGLKIRDVPVEDEGTVLDMDTPQDYKNLLHKKGDGHIYLHSRLVLETDEAFFGPGTAQLLEMIDLTGSITAACQAMHMSYTKAWKMLNQVEKKLGEKVVVRMNGGAEGGGTYLTQQGRQLLKAYRNMQRELRQTTDSLLKKYFGDRMQQPTKEEQNGRVDSQAES